MLKLSNLAYLFYPSPTFLSFSPLSLNPSFSPLSSLPPFFPPHSSREPTHDYKNDSVFQIEPPVVSPQDERIYERAISIMTKGPLPPPHTSLELYSQYAKMIWR